MRRKREQPQDCGMQQKIKLNALLHRDLQSRQIRLLGAETLEAGTGKQDATHVATIDKSHAEAGGWY
jgi:hypothetical protein